MAGSNVVYNSVLNPKSSIHTPPKGWGVRHLQILLLFVCVVVGFTTRAQLSVLMVAMIDSSVHNNCNVSNKDISINDVDANDSNTECIKQNISDWSVYRTYDWDKSTQEMIMFSFFVGYTSMQLPMGLLTQKIGGKKPIMIALFVNGILSLCTPWIPLIGGWIAVSTSRLIQGMTQAAYYPSLHTMLARWTPLRERARLTTYAFTGSQIGTIVAFQTSGLLAGSPLLGWPAPFWLFGCLSLAVCGLFGRLGAATPHNHPKITSEELVYISEDCNADIVPKNRKTPWKEILKCKSIWGIMATHAGSSAGYLLVLTEMPLYMSNVLGVEIKKNGLYSSLPYVAMSFMSILFGNMADYARNQNLMKIVNIRRTMNTIGMVASGIFLIAFSYTRNIVLAVSLLTLSMGTHSGVHVGFIVNQIDLAPNFAGSIMAISNMVANLSSLIVPVVVSNIVTDVKDYSQWRIVFFIFIGFQFITNAIFVIFAKGEVQPWNFYGDMENEADEKELSFIKEKKDFGGKK